MQMFFHMNVVHFPTLSVEDKEPRETVHVLYGCNFVVIQERNSCWRNTLFAHVSYLKDWLIHRWTFARSRFYECKSHGANLWTAVSHADRCSHRVRVNGAVGRSVTLNMKNYPPISSPVFFLNSYLIYMYQYLKFDSVNGFSSSPRNTIHVNVFHGTPGKVGVYFYVYCVLHPRIKHV